MRTRRVGSVTCGISLIFFGIMFLLRLFNEKLSYSYILRFWPIILIGIGIEILAAVFRCRSDEACTLKYDKGAVILMILLLLFASCIASMELFLQYAETHPMCY